MDPSACPDSTAPPSRLAARQDTKLPSGCSYSVKGLLVFSRPTFTCMGGQETLLLGFGYNLVAMPAAGMKPAQESADVLPGKPLRL